MANHSMRGFSLVELAITVLVLGIVFSFSVPAFQSLSSTYQLRGAAENVAGEFRLAREKAIATGQEQALHFPNNNTYHIHYYPSGPITTIWTLPRGISFTGSTVNSWIRLRPDGTCLFQSGTGLVVLQNTRGTRDTVSVQLSGLILTR